MSALTHTHGDASPFQFVEMIGDAMEPTLRGGRDLVMAVPVDGYCGEGLYVFDDGQGQRIVRCQCVGPSSIRMSNDNPPGRAGYIVDLGAFNAARLAFVVADVKVRDIRMLRAAFDRRPA